MEEINIYIKWSRVKISKICFIILATNKHAYVDNIWIHKTDYKILQLFLLSTTLLITSTHLDSPANNPIPILLQILLCIYLIIYFIPLIPFPTLLCIYLTILFVRSFLQLYFSIYHTLSFVPCYAHLVQMHYALGVRVSWVPVMVYVIFISFTPIYDFTLCYTDYFVVLDSFCNISDVGHRCAI